MLGFKRYGTSSLLSLTLTVTLMVNLWLSARCQVTTWIGSIHDLISFGYVGPDQGDKSDMVVSDMFMGADNLPS